MPKERYNKNKNTDFLFDYKKYIIQQRIKAYELLEEFLDYPVSSIGKQPYDNLFQEHNGVSNYSEFMKDLHTIQKESVWFTDDISSVLHELCELFKKIPQMRQGSGLVKRLEAAQVGLAAFRHNKNLHVWIVQWDFRSK